MKKVLALLAMSLMLAGCPKGNDIPSEDPLPPQPKPTISALAVSICIDSSTFVRRPDSWCGDSLNAGGEAGHRWAYPYNTPNWDKYELPAVGERIDKGWAFPNPPAGIEEPLPQRIPTQGARFVR